MPEKIDNPVSRKIVNSVYNRLGDYFPEISRHREGLRNWYTINARLPEEIHKKWISRINSNRYFRGMVKGKIEEIFSSYIFNGQSFLEIRWARGGTSFETDGINGCMVFVSADSGVYNYSCHNIDSFEQAMVLFIALSIYLPFLYFALESFESGNVDVEKFPPLEDRIIQRITLNQVQGCQMKYGECIHWASTLCDLCTRNPKARSILKQQDLSRIGDKWEPEGGFPGRELCSACGANMSTGKCPFCDG